MDAIETSKLRDPLAAALGRVDLAKDAVDTAAINLSAGGADAAAVELRFAREQLGAARAELGRLSEMARAADRPADDDALASKLVSAAEAGYRNAVEGDPFSGCQNRPKAWAEVRRLRVIHLARWLAHALYYERRKGLGEAFTRAERSPP